MGRPKGSKNKKTKAQEQLQAQEKPVKKKRTRTRIKKIVNNSNTEKIKTTLEKARKNGDDWTEEQKARFSHVLILE